MSPLQQQAYSLGNDSGCCLAGAISGGGGVPLRDSTGGRRRESISVLQGDSHRNSCGDLPECAALAQRSTARDDCRLRCGPGRALPTEAGPRYLRRRRRDLFDLPILVLIELASGFIFTEVKSAKRTYQSWSEQLQSWWQDSQWQCHFLVSDGARALVKLALSGIGCVSVPDLFHAMRALGRPIDLLARALKSASQQVDKLSEKLAKTTNTMKRQTLKARLTEALAQQQQEEQNQQTYHQALATITTCIHPFSYERAQRQTDDALTTALAAPLKILAGLAPLNNTAPVDKAIAAFETQIPDLAAGIQAWWQWITQALAAETSEADTQNWVLTAMLPWVYWTQQADKTRQPELKRQYQTAASDAFDALIAYPFTARTDDLQQNAGNTGVCRCLPNISAPPLLLRVEMAISLNGTMSRAASLNSR